METRPFKKSYRQKKMKCSKIRREGATENKEPPLKYSTVFWFPMMSLLIET